MDGLWATKNEGVGPIVRAISFQDFQTVYHKSLTLVLQTDRRTDEYDMQSQDRALHCSASRGDNIIIVLCH